jgi:hypothetical protein
MRVDIQLLKNIITKIAELQLIAKENDISLYIEVRESDVNLHIIKYVKTPYDIFKPTQIKTLHEEKIEIEDDYDVIYSVITTENV